MNTQEIQEILNHLIIGITALYTIVMVVDFVVGIVHLWQKFTLNIESHTNNAISEESYLESIDINKSLKLENQNQSTNRITSKPEPQPDNFISIDVDKIDLLEHFEEVPEQLWQLLCLTHSP